MRLLSTGVASAALLAGILYLINPPVKGFKIPSIILEEKRTVLVSLPMGYDSSSKSYPVLILLDASRRRSAYGPSFDTIAENLKSLGDPVPEMIVLGIPNTDRNRDMLPVHDPELPTSGKARRFLLFITDELIPRVRTGYRTSDELVLYGRSDSGLFALYTLTEAPGVFRAVIASSPTLGHCPGFMTENVDRLFHERPDLAGTLFIIYGAEEGSMVAGHIPAFVRAIEEAASPKFNLSVRSVPGGGHVPKSSLEDGLRFVFSPALAPDK